jgi:hypothetical protein
MENGRPTVEVLAQTADSQPKRYRFSDMTATELWAAYHFIRPGQKQKEDYGLEDGECALLGMTRTDYERDGNENKVWEFAVHPALANSSLAREAMRLDMLIGTHALPPFAGLKGKWETYQWYDEAAVISIRDSTILINAAKGPRENLLRVRFWGDLKAEVGAEVSFESGPAITALASEVDCLHRVDRLARIITLLNWIADNETIPFPKLPPDTKASQMNIEPKMTLAEATILADPLPARRQSKPRSQ